MHARPRSTLSTVLFLAASAAAAPGLAAQTAAPDTTPVPRDSLTIARIFSRTSGSPSASTNAE